MTTLAIPLKEADSITVHVCREHDALKALLREVCDDVESGRLEAALGSCAAFDRHLARHIGVEESLLFPLFEARVGIVGGPTDALRREHQDIRRSLGLMREALERGDAHAFEDSLCILRTTLRQHFSKEEHVLFPTTDAALSQSQQAALVERLRREARWGGAGRDGQPPA